jgi:hypothetical protein
LTVQDWQVTSAYPMTSLFPEGGGHRLRWFLKVNKGGTVQDLLTGTEANGLFVEMLYAFSPLLALAPGFSFHTAAHITASWL